MKITKQSFGYVLETGIAVIVFDIAKIQKIKIGADIDLLAKGCGQILDVATIPNQHIKEFEKAFISASGVIE